MRDTQADLYRLLPGAVIRETTGDREVYVKEVSNPDLPWVPTRGGVNVDLARGPWEVLHPGFVIDGEGQIVEAFYAAGML